MITNIAKLAKHDNSKVMGSTPSTTPCNRDLNFQVFL